MERFYKLPEEETPQERQNTARINALASDVLNFLTRSCNLVECIAIVEIVKAYLINTALAEGKIIKETTA